MANHLIGLILLLTLLDKSTPFAFAPSCREIVAQNHLCQTANHDDGNIVTGNTSSSPQIAEEAFSALRSIGVDYGLTRTGVGITNGGYSPRPLAILSNLNNTELSSTIVNYVITEQATNIVLGLPLHKDGSDSEQSNITRAFGQCLLREVRQRCGAKISITLWDERYTSKEAATRIKAEAIARKSRIPSASDLQTELDADSACIILEDYYKELGEDGELIVFDDEAVERECAEIYARNLELQQDHMRSLIEEREKGRNARKEMIARARAEEFATTNGLSQKKKKKKKKKKK